MVVSVRLSNLKPGKEPPMGAAEIQIRARSAGQAARTDWVRAGAALFGAAWGSNQFTPMLLIYHGQLGLSTGTLEALFGVYALGLIPGLLIAGPVSDAWGRRPVVTPPRRSRCWAR